MQSTLRAGYFPKTPLSVNYTQNGRLCWLRFSEEFAVPEGGKVGANLGSPSVVTPPIISIGA